MICSDFISTRYYVPDFEVGSIGYIVDCPCDGYEELHAVKIVSVIPYSKDAVAYEVYLNLEDDERNNYMDAEYSCEFILEEDNYVVGFDYLTSKDLVITRYC